MALFGLFKSNRDLWLEQIQGNPTLKKAILEFFVKDNISILKFIENQKANKFASFNLQSSINAVIANKINPTPTFKQYLLLHDNRSLEMPEWFYFAYPDVFVWFSNNDEKFADEFDKLAESTLSHHSEEDGQYILLRYMINKYLVFFDKLECTD